MLRVLLLLALTLGIIPSPAVAIPVCPTGTMQDYLGFGSGGCQVNSLTFSNFSYNNFGGVFLPGGDGLLVFPPPSGISVAPRSDPPRLGSGGAALHMTPFPLVPDTYWKGVNIGFAVAGPGILRNDLSGRLHLFADLQLGILQQLTVPGGGLGGSAGFSSCLENPVTCLDTSSNISFPPTPVQTVLIFGENFNDVETAFATPEPTTLLLVGAPGAGLGVARWVKRRRSRNHS